MNSFAGAGRATTPKAVLLDLGNVVLEVDFRRTFAHWAKHANVSIDHLRERWLLDDAYRQHEIGQLNFVEYADSLSQRLEISLPMHHWEQGWNDLFVGPYGQVQQCLEVLNRQLPLFAFTNTNPTHETLWRALYPQALRHFREIYVSSTIGQRKPDRKAYEFVATAMGFEPAEILFLDDTQENIVGALESGLQARWVRGEAEVVQVLDEIKTGPGG